MKLLVFRASFLLIVVAAARPACAQDGPARVEIGGQIAGLRLVTGPGETGPTPGAGAHVSVALTPRLALESRLLMFPRREPILSQSQGGQTLQFSVGVRGTFLRGRRASLYGVVLPGVMHFSNTLTGLTATSPSGSGTASMVVHDVVGPATHFTLAIGGGVEFLPSRRTFLRAQVTGDMYVSPAVSVPLPANASGSFLTFSYPAKIVGTAQVSATIGYRLGAFSASRAGSTMSGRWMFGGQLGGIVSSDVFGQAISRVPGLGGFVSYRLFDHVDIDASISTDLRPAALSTPFEGGRIIQTLGGVKIGARDGRLGLFAKARAGVTSHARAVESVAGVSFAPAYGRNNVLAIDVGGVIEMAVSRRLLLRFDAGDTISVFHDVTVMVSGMTFVERPSPARTDSMHLTMGIGVRF